MPESVDVLIRGASVYDGTGAPPHRADVALRGDRIVSVGDGASLHANVSLDAAGLALAPGFIDVHTHDDFALVVRPEMDFKILGGVTTVVVGNCGMGAAPWPLARGMAAAFHPGVPLPEWEGYAGYFARLEREPASVNAAALVGHSTARAAVMGNAQRAASGAELDAIRAIVREGRDAGAVGLSTGLIYEPGRYADAAEITALAAEFVGTGGLYASHMRDEGDHVTDSLEETFRNLQGSYQERK
jgi:N-acyl-D-amino-acid deacylase